MNYSIIVHFDEIVLKGKNKSKFIMQLRANIRELVPGFNIDKLSNGFLLVPEQKIDSGELDVTLQKISLIPGISHVAPVLTADTEIESIYKQALEIVNYYKPKTFKIETSRTYKKFPLTSPIVSRDVGGYVLQNYQDELKGDVHNPELTLKIEIEKDKTYLLGKKVEGVSGIPVGSAGKILCLLSGGIDSPVAAFQMMRRGAKVNFIHFHNQTINKKGVENKIKELVERLEKIQGKSRLIIVPFADLQKEVISKCPAAERMIVYRRTMYKIAELIAKKEGYGALVTGDSLSQVASQTLENLQVIYQAADMLKLAPLMGSNKRDIMKEAVKIGTYDISIKPYEDCCSLLIAKHPQTRGELDNILKIEEKLNLDQLIQEAIDKVN